MGLNIATGNGKIRLTTIDYRGREYSFLGIV